MIGTELACSLRVGRIVTVLLVVGGMVGCGPAVMPKAKVLGVGRTTTADYARLFVELNNPTIANLALSKIRYRLSVNDWFEAEGDFPVSRTLAAGATIIVEVPIKTAPLSAPGQSARYQFAGELFALDSSVSRTWRLRADGVLDSSAFADNPNRAPIASFTLARCARSGPGPRLHRKAFPGTFAR